MNSFLDKVFQAVAVGKPVELFQSDRKYSFVYITDVFRAIVFAMTTLEKDQVYNVAGVNSTVSTGMAAALLHDIYDVLCRPLHCWYSSNTSKNQ